MTNCVIASAAPMDIANRVGWKTIHVVLDIQRLSIGQDVVDFESESGFLLSSDAPRKEVYFHSDKHGEDELVFFGLELKGNQVHLLPGNSNVETVWVDPSYSVCSAQPVQHKRRA